VSDKWEGKDFYDILGISSNAGRDEIRAVYRRLAFELHPDRNPNSDASDRLSEVIEAYTVLSNPGSRAEYDAILFDDRPSAQSQPIADGFNLGGAYDQIASQKSADQLISAREEYLKHLDRSRRRKTAAEIIIALLILALLFAYGFSPLKTSSGPIAPSSNSSGNAQGGSSNLDSNNSENNVGLNGVLTVIQGSNGAVGVIGRDGARGLDGRPGVDGIPGAPGQDGTVGPAGATGPAGAAGPTGAAGAPGAAGPAGAAGAAGVAGVAGPQGETGTAASVYSISPNIGAAVGFIKPCTINVNSTETTTVNVFVEPKFNVTSNTFKVGSFNLSNFPVDCAGKYLGLVISLENPISSARTISCVKSSLPNYTNLDKSQNTFRFDATNTSLCTWTDNSPADITDLEINELYYVRLVLSG